MTEIARKHHVWTAPVGGSRAGNLDREPDGEGLTGEARGAAGARSDGPPQSSRDKIMPKLATVAAFAAIATSSLAMAGTDAADKVMLAALERAAEQRASQAADMAEAIANRVVSLKDRDEASIKAASKDKTAACHEADVAQSAREIADRYYCG